MLTGNLEHQGESIKKSAKGNAESEQMPNYMLNKYSQIFQSPEPIRIPKGKKVFPTHKYGHSYESPTYFINKHSVLCRETYNNPFLNQTNEKSQSTKNNKFQSLRSNTLRNTEFFKVTDQNFQNDQHDAGAKNAKMFNTITNTVTYVRHPSITQENYNFENAYKSMDQVFGIKKELFTDFIEKNDTLNVYGPLNMRDRPKDFRAFKDFTLTQTQINVLKQARSMSQLKSPTSMVNSSTVKQLPKFKTLPKLVKSQLNLTFYQQIRSNVPRDEDRFFTKDQIYLNQFYNTIIRDKMAKQVNKFVKKSLPQPYNSDRDPAPFEENEDHMIELFEKHLEFEKQYNT